MHYLSLAEEGFTPGSDHCHIHALAQVYGPGFGVSAVEQTRHMQDSQGQILALA